MASPRTCHLLDVNVLIALADPAHVHHDAAHDWFGAVGRHAFATCPITENGMLRIIGHPKYPNSPGPPGTVLPALQAFRALPGHVFWPDSISLAAFPALNASQLGNHTQLTDTYLLALAVAHGGRLATLDHRLLATPVAGGDTALLRI